MCPFLYAGCLLLHLLPLKIMIGFLVWVARPQHMMWQVTCKIGSCNADSKTRRSKFTLQSCFLLHHKTVYYSRKNTSGIFYFTLGTVPDLWVLAWLSVKFKRRPGRPPRSPILFFYMYPNAACSLQVSQTQTTYLSDSELHDRGYLPQNVLLVFILGMPTATGLTWVAFVTSY